MKLFFTYLIITVMAFNISAQGFKEKSFNAMIKTMLSHSVKEVKAKNLQYDSTVLYLDAREINEFNVSKIQNAQWVGYDDFELSRVEEIDKDKEIIVYCSIGYRSEKVAEKLEADGFTNVTNMVGGVFSWVNYDNPLVDSTKTETNKVHAYSTAWGIWIDGKKAVKIYD